MTAILILVGKTAKRSRSKSLFRPSQSFFEFVDPRLVGELFKLRMLRSMHRYARGFFKNERLARLVEWPVLFLGASARESSAMYSLMSYADMALGTWYPPGGMHRIIEAMVKVAQELGVEFRLGEAVDEDEEREKLFDMVMDRLERHTGRPLRDRLLVKRSYAMKDFEDDYGAFKGNAYGMANTLRQTGPLKPTLRSNKVRGLYYAGQLTVPGPGMPPSLVSGELSAKVLIDDFGQ